MRLRERGLGVARVSSWKLRMRLWARTLSCSQALLAPVVARGDDVQSELALELGQGLLLGAAAADEGVQGRQI